MKLLSCSETTAAHSVPTGIIRSQALPRRSAGYFTSDKEKLDLAVVPGLDVLLGDGDGVFGRPVAYSSNMVPSSVVAQDFDGDGVIDLAVAEPGNVESAVTVYSGSADGSFRTGGFFPVGTHTGLNFIAAADFNGDGKPDLACVNYTDGTVTILLNTGVVSFSPTTPLSFKNKAVGTTSKPQTVTLTNTGTTELKIQSMKASSEFGLSSICGDRVAPGAKCTISATFSPTKEGSAQGTITIIDSASTKPQVIELLGTGTSSRKPKTTSAASQIRRSLGSHS
jgi:hypothetical protein